jgi:hypothetical protein
MNEKKFIAEQVYDFLMENNYTRLDFVKNFPDSWYDYGKGIIYLSGSENLNEYKITVEIA